MDYAPFTLSEIEDAILNLNNKGKAIPCELSALIPTKLDEHIRFLEDKLNNMQNSETQNTDCQKKLVHELETCKSWKAKREYYGFDDPESKHKYEKANGLPAEVFEIIEKEIYFCRNGM